MSAYFPFSQLILSATGENIRKLTNSNSSFFGDWYVSGNEMCAKSTLSDISELYY